MEVNRNEIHEVYVLCRLLAQGFIYSGRPDGTIGKQVPLAAVVRQEVDGVLHFNIEEGDVVVRGHGRYPRADFALVADYLLHFLIQNGEAFDVSDVEAFFQTIGLQNWNAPTQDRTHLHVALWHPDAPLIGLRIQGRLCGYTPLLSGGRMANLKWEQTGIRFSHPAVLKINYTENPDSVPDVVRRILYIESVGGVFKFADVCDRVFRSNLLMIDTNLPRILGTMVRTLYMDNVSRMTDLIAMLRETNPLKMKSELVEKHDFYAYKVCSLLLASAWGMRPGKAFDGKYSAIGGYVMVDTQGGLLLYTRAQEEVFAQYLVNHTRLEKGSPEGDKYGFLERENGLYYMKLNLRIGFLKR